MRGMLTLFLAGAIAMLPGCGSSDSDPAATASLPRDRGGPASDSGKNVLVHNGITMHVRSVVAVLDPAESTLRFELLPFEVSETDLERCRKDETFFLTTEKSSPDPTVFPDRVPYATYALNWFGGGDEFGDVAKGFHSLNAHFIRKPGGNLSLSFQPTTYEFRLEGKIADGARVHLVARGGDTLGKEEIRWNLDFRVPIRTAIPRDRAEGTITASQG